MSRRILAVCLVFVLLPCSFAFASEVDALPTMPPLDAPIEDVAQFYTKVFALSHEIDFDGVSLITQSIDGKLSLNFNFTARPFDPAKDYLRNCFSMALDVTEALSFYPGYDNLSFVFSGGLVRNVLDDVVITLMLTRDSIRSLDFDYARVCMIANPMYFAESATSYYIHPTYRIK